MFEKLQADYQRFLEIEQSLLDPAIASNPTQVTSLSRERGKIAKTAVLYGRYLDLGRRIDEAEVLCRTESDADLRAYAEDEAADLRRLRDADADALRDILYDREAGADHAALIIEIRAGTGGDEAALFARDLFEMYRRFSEMKGWRVELLDMEATELAGFREVSFSVTGEGAFRLLQFESGGHRVQRVPQTETQGRIHTSAATVAVLPEPEEVDVDIRNEDVRIDVMCAGGPGGQHQNKTESGVRLTHLPTGIVVNCRDERSQHKNKAKAFRVLRSRIYERMQEETRAVRDHARRTLIGSGDRSQRIRTYNFPQNRVTDHRIGLTIYNLDRVIQGELQDLLQALIDHDRREQLGDL